MACLTCQRVKVLKQAKVQIRQFQLPSARFQAVHIDPVAPIIPAKNTNDSSPYKYILTCIDRTTKWVEAQPLLEIITNSVADNFMNTWIAHFDTLLNIITEINSLKVNYLWNYPNRVLLT